MITIVRYSAKEETTREWDRFIEGSRNGTFLFFRAYMDYHKERFTDHSLIFYNDSKLIALLPANEREKVLYSHQGLTYGGLIIGSDTTTIHVIEIFECLGNYLKSIGITRVRYKDIPWIYHTLPSEEPLYAMHVVCKNYKIVERDVSSTIDLHNRLKWRESRKSGLRNARKHNIKVTFSEDYATFWRILNDNLLNKHNAKPVHTLEEITLLHDRFPRNILLAVAQQDGNIIGGSVVYVTKQVIHTQYISATEEGKHMGAIDATIDFLLDSFDSQRYFDFGKSTEANSYILNRNLLFQKEGFGARTVCYDTYEWTL